MPSVFALNRAVVIRWRPMTRSVAFAILLGLLGCAWSAAGAHAQANVDVGTVLGSEMTPRDPFPEIAAIEGQLDQLAGRPDAQVVETLVRDARQALQRARVLAQQGHSQASERAKQIAWAALAAASHSLARHQAEIERAVIERTKQLALTAAAAARQALDHARAQAGSIETRSP